MRLHIAAFALAAMMILLFGIAEATAQSYTCVTRTIVTPDGSGGCCSLSVRYCYRVYGTTVDYYIDQITVPSGCNIVPNPGLIGWLQKKILYQMSIDGILPAAIPTCPTTTTLVVVAKSGNCMVLIPPVPGQTTKVYGLCGTNFCVRSCQVCLSTTEMDPCSPNQSTPMIVFVGCNYTGTPCNFQNNSEGCEYNTCVSE